MKKPLILLAMVAALMILPFFINHGGEFGGSDGEAESQIQVVAPDYQPWFQPLYEPASGEIESLLFTLQGSLGAAVPEPRLSRASRRCPECMSRAPRSRSAGSACRVRWRRFRRSTRRSSISPSSTVSR